MDSMKMYHHGVYRNYQSWLVDELGYIQRQGVRVESRVGMTTEVLHETFTILRPKERFVHLNSRRNNPIATIAETLWVLSGRNDLAFLEHYLPRAKQFSDDGLTWRAGYGPRIRHWGKNGSDDVRGVDQVASVASRLTLDKNTRRAVIGIWDPALDNVESKDVPCNDLLTFQLRHNTLYMTATLRSQDIIWGSMVNMFEWSVLHEALAAHCGAVVGPETYMVASMHLYDRHQEMANRIINEGQKASHPIYDTGIGEEEKSSAIFSPLNIFDGDLYNAMLLEPHMRAGMKLEQLLHECETITNPFVRDSVLAIGAYNAFKLDSSFYLPAYIEQMEGYDMRYAVYGYINSLQRALKTGNGSASDSGIPHGPEVTVKTIVDNLIDLQARKNATYRDSWKRHGEILSIMPNITRKYDRLQAMNAEGMLRDNLTDETLLDTVGDFAVYCGLYASWLSGQSFEQEMRDNTAEHYTTEQANAINYQTVSVMQSIDETYDILEKAVLGREDVVTETKLRLARLLMSLAVAWLAMVA